MQASSPSMMIPDSIPVTQTAASAASKVRNASTSGTAGSSAGTDLGATFLGLLSQELKNQDPTQPIDPTAMVGQMISLNQLDQLISINQRLTPAASGSSNTGAATNSQASEPAVSAQNAIASAQSNPANQLPFDPQTMLPIDFSHPGGNATFNPQTAITANPQGAK